MPELPEVETIVRELRRLVVGRTIRRAALHHEDVLDGVRSRTLVRGLTASTISAISRRAKHVVVQTDRGILAIQPGMTGAVLFFDRPLRTDEARYVVLHCELGHRESLVYRDVRRIGTIRWLTSAGWHRYQERLGPEPLDPAFTANDFADRVSRSRAAIKKVMMDQRVVVGIGNIYAAEALFAAGIDPSRPANKVRRDQLVDLHVQIKRILRSAIRRGGTTVRDYRNSADEPGRFQRSLHVYGRAGEPCTRCGRRLAQTHEIDGRATAFCWNCQR